MASAERYPTKDQLVTWKVETTPGTDPSPTPGANAVRIETPELPYNGAVDRAEAEVGAGLDAGNPVALGLDGAFRGRCRLRGAGTAGTAPDYAPGLRGCGLAETLLASAEAGAAQAGSTSTVTLEAAASATDNIFVGMPIRMTSGAANGDVRVITAYNGTTKVASVFPDFSSAPSALDTYSIDAAASYTPASTGLETIGIYRYRNSNIGSTNSVLSKLLGAAGNLDLEVATRAVGFLNFTFAGITPATPRSDVTRPTGVSLTSAEARNLRNADIYLGTETLPLNSLRLSMNNRVQLPDDPAAANGKDYAQITGRSIGGTIRANSRLIATRDVLADFLAGTGKKFWMRWGTTAGERVSLYMPDVRPVTPGSESDNQEFLSDDVEFAANGQDSGFVLTLY